MPNNYFFSIILIISLMPGCGIYIHNSLEKMSSEQRINYLRSMSTDDLCGGFNNILVKPETEKDIRNILIEREQERCDARGKVKVVYLKNFKPYEKSNSTSSLDIKPVILPNINSDQNENLMKERHLAVMNGQKVTPIDNNFTTKQDKIKFVIVSEERWTEILATRKKQIEGDWLQDLAVSLAERSQENLKKDDLQLSSEFKLMSYIITNYVFKDKDSNAILPKIKISLYDTGLNDDILSESNKNFLNIINKLYSKEDSKVLTRNATSSDRKTKEINKQNSDIKNQVKLKKHSTDKKEATKKITEDNSKKTEESSTKENIEPQKTQDIKENQQSLDKKEPIKIKSFFDL
jgi:hypothetical protein